MRNCRMTSRRLYWFFLLLLFTRQPRVKKRKSQPMLIFQLHLRISAEPRSQTSTKFLATSATHMNHIRLPHPLVEHRHRLKIEPLCVNFFFLSNNYISNMFQKNACPLKPYYEDISLKV